MTSKKYSEVWDLETLFPGGSDSKQFAQHLDNAEMEISLFHKMVRDWHSGNIDNDKAALKGTLQAFERAAKKIRQAGAFIGCLQAQDTNDRKVSQLEARLSGLRADFQNALSSFDRLLSLIDDPSWSEILKDSAIAELSFVLSERRSIAKEKLTPEQEALINVLSIDGYDSWGQMYDLIVGKMKIVVNEHNQKESLSVGQAHNRFSSSNRQERSSMFRKWEEAWGGESDYFAKILNHLAGFRLKVYEQRGWEDHLKEPLAISRMKKETLEAMWAVINENKQYLVQYLNRKASLLGIERMSWYDLDAPLGKAISQVSYQEGAEFIQQQFSQFGEKLATFARKAFEEKWIEAEDRAGKAPGGFCTYFPESGESRIFMTYSGTPSNVSTLAHELGHGFHSAAMHGVHYLNRNYAMNVAETASTFAEMIVSDASVKTAKSNEEKLALLDDKIQRTVALLMNIHARFLFETRFYEERKHGLVPRDRLNEIMLDAQKEAYSDALEEYHPLFWASKLHFFITDVPFYNFPYTFGYLFSLGIYSQALKEGKNYEEKYIALLKDTACMTVEDLAKKHLQVDLSQQEFWRSAVKMCVDDIEEFLRLTE